MKWEEDIANVVSIIDIIKLLKNITKLKEDIIVYQLKLYQGTQNYHTEKIGKLMSNLRMGVRRIS